MNVRSTDFRVEEGDQVKLDKRPTAVEPIYESKKHYQKLLKRHVEELSSLQQLLYASSRYDRASTRRQDGERSSD